MSEKRKVETLQEFLARGGSITKVAAVTTDIKPEVTRQTTVGPANLMTLDQGELYYAETKKGSKPKKVKPVVKIDLNALPEALRKKFINKLKEETDGEGFEEIEEVQSKGDETEDSEAT